MSTDQAASPSSPGQIRVVERNIGRFALGVLISVLLAMAFAWPLSHVTPVLVGMLLGPPAQPVPAKVIRALVLYLVLAYLLGFGLVLLTRNYPVVAVLAMGLMLFFLFAKAAQGLNLLVVIMFMLAVMVYPLLALMSSEVSMGAAQGFILTMLVAVLVAQLSYLLIPASPPGTSAAKPAAATDLNLVYRNAALSTLVVLPLLCYFMLFDKQGAILVVVYVALLAITPDLTGGIKAILGMLLANLVGGVTAVMVYELLVMAPFLPFYLALIVGVSLVYGRLIFGSTKGALYSSAFNAVLLLVGSATGSAGGDAETDFYTRLFLIFLAGLYLNLSFMLLTSLGLLGRQSQTT